MRTWKVFFSTILAFVIPVVFAQTPLEGSWVSRDEKTGEKRAVLNLIINDGVLTGTVERVFSKPGELGVCSKCPGKFKDKPIVGMKIIWGLKETGPNTWDGGRVLDAQTGSIYRLKMTLKEDKLHLRGYLGISLLGRTQVWERA